MIINSKEYQKVNNLTNSLPVPSIISSIKIYTIIGIVVAIVVVGGVFLVMKKRK